MPKTARRQIYRIVGASCLTAALVVPSTVVAAAQAASEAPGPAAGPAAPDQGTASGQDVPITGTPGPGGPGPGTPGPGTPEPEGPEEGPNTPEQQTPDTGEPETPDTGTPEPGTTEPGTPTQEGPTTGSPGPTRNFGPVQPPPPGSAAQKAQAAVDSLNAPEDLKKQLREGVAAAQAAINAPGTSAADKLQYLRYLGGVTKSVELIQAPGTTDADRALYMKTLRAADVAVKRSVDTKLTAEQRNVYRTIAQGLAQAPAAIAAANTPQKKAELAISAELTSDGLLAVVDPPTAPTLPPDKERITNVLQANAAAMATLGDPNAPQAAKDEAQRTLDATANATQNSKYQEFLAEVKKYDPPQGCIDVIETRTNQAGWPDGSLWGLSDDACADTLATAAEDTGSKWNPLFVCVLNGPFSACVGTIPED